MQLSQEKSVGQFATPLESWFFHFGSKGGLDSKAFKEFVAGCL
jgi:hypothetical protein